MSLRQLLPSTASNWKKSWRPRPSIRGGRAIRERLALEPLETRTLLSAGPMDSGAAIPSQPDYFIADVRDETALVANASDAGNAGNISDVFLPDCREAADTAVSLLSQFDGQEGVTSAIFADFAAMGSDASNVAGTNATDAEVSPEEDGHRLVVNGDDGSQFVLEYSFESGTSSDGHVTFSRFSFTVEYYAFANALPTADAGGPYEIVEGDPLTLDASASSDADGDSLSYSWDLDGDGEFEDASGADPVLNWEELAALGINDDGTYTVDVQVDDGFGGQDRATATVSVQNAAPVAVIEILDNSVEMRPGSEDTSDDVEITIVEGTSIDMVGTAIDPGIVDTHTFDWSVMRNGEPYDSHVGQYFHFTPDDNGVYQVGLSVTDDDGGVGLAGATIEATNVAPEVAIAGAPETVPEGTLVTLDADVVDSGPVDTFTLEWNVTKNGQQYQSGGDTSFSFTPDDDGIYVATLKVTDDDGDATTAESVIEVTNVDPEGTIDGLPDSADEGAEISFDAVVSDPGTADTHTVNWHVAKDGEDYRSGSGEHFGFAPDDNGLYEVSLTVTDDDGGTSQTTSQVNVQNVAPELGEVAGTPWLAEGESFSLSGNISDPGTADAFELAVDWGDGVPETFSYPAGTTGFNETHQYDSGGIYTVGLTLADDDLASAVASQTASVSGVGVHDGVLQVVGTQQSDIVFVDRLDGDQFLVVADFLQDASRSRSVDAAGIDQIEIILADGNDLAVVSDNVETPSLVDGGTGNDLIQGGRGNDVLLGGDGHDLLAGGSGRDLLIGGLGIDYLLGNLADDVVIGGSTDENVNDQALLTMMDEWF